VELLVDLGKELLLAALEYSFRLVDFDYIGHLDEISVYNG
jgi:hypothetical protein